MEAIARHGRMMRYGKSCLLLVNVHDDGACLAKWVFPETEWVKREAAALDRAGYLHPSIPATRRLPELQARSATVGAGRVEATSEGPRKVIVSGEAGSTSGARPADAVVLARRTGEGWQPLFIEPVDESGHWRRALRGPDLARSTGEIGAWAFDAETAQAAPLDGVLYVQ
jgi:hypothetical protein